jgi:hypothetical protein
MVVLFSGGSLLLGRLEGRWFSPAFKPLSKSARTVAQPLSEPGEDISLWICAKVMFEYMHRTKRAKHHIGSS